MAAFIEKTCSKCGAIKNGDAFFKDSSKKDGRRSTCKACDRATDGQQVVRRRMTNHAYYHRNKGRIKAEKQRYRLRNRARIAAQKRRYYHEQSASHRARANRYYEQHKELFQKWSRESRLRHTDRNKERAQQWRTNNPHVIKALRARRKARLRNAAGRFTGKQWQALCEWFGNICLCCGAPPPLTVDHVIPLISGGSNDISNVQPLCGSCNFRKHTKTHDYRDAGRLAAFLEAVGTSSNP